MVDSVFDAASNSASAEERIAAAVMEDVQGSTDSRHISIDKVGIRRIRHPVRVRDRSQGEQHTIASFDMYVDLPHNFKGTHMSRFVEVLNNQEYEITVASFRNILTEMAQRLEARSGHIAMNFPYFIKRYAPVTKVPSLMDYDVTLLGYIANQETSMGVSIVVPVTSLCPCSKKISDRGAHNQRSHVTVTAMMSRWLWLEDLIDMVESEASSKLYGLLKRPDEKYVTEYAYDNPKFVEDMVRDVAAHLNQEPRIICYIVESENFESIHNHSAYAAIEHSKVGNDEKDQLLQVMRPATKSRYSDRMHLPL